MPGGATIAIHPTHISGDALPGTAETVTVYAKPGTPVSVALQPVERLATGQCVTTAGEVPWAAVRPASFTVGKSGAHRVHIRLHTHGASGLHDVAIMAREALPGNGNVHFSEAVGTQFIAAYPGHAPKGQRPCEALTAPPGHASSVVPFVIVSAVLIVAAIGVWAFLLRYLRHSRRSRV